VKPEKWNPQRRLSFTIIKDKKTNRLNGVKNKIRRKMNNNTLSN
jgi:hypothetical protein